MWPPKLDLLINILIRQFFNSSCFIVVSDNGSGLNLPSGSMVVRTEPSSIPTTVFHNFGCRNFILDVPKPVHTFRSLEDEIGRHRESLHSRKYLILTTGPVFEDSFRVFCDVLLVNVSKFPVPSVWFVREEIEATLWKFQHLTPHQVLLDKWFSINQSFLWNHPIIAEDHVNLKGYRIKVGTFHHVPFAIVGKNFNTNPMDISGTDIELVRAFAQYTNVSLEFRLTDGLWGEILNHKNASGMKGLIMKGELDVGAAGFYYAKRTYEYMDLSTIYLISELTCLVPEPRLLAPWLSPCYGFSTSTWISLLITYPILICALFLIKGRNDKDQLTILELQKSTLLVLKLAIQQSVSRKELEKYFTKSWMIFSLTILATMVVNIAYSAGYASVMTKPIYQDSIDTAEDFLNSDLPWASWQSADWIKVWKNEGEGRFKKTAERYTSANDSTERLRSIMKRGEYGILSFRINGQNHPEVSMDEDTVEKYVEIKGTVHTEPIALAVRRNFALLPIINRVILWLTQTGIIGFWTRKASSDSKAVFHRKPKQAKSLSLRPVMLRIEHLLGAFYILLFGYGIASIVFALEWRYPMNFCYFIFKKSN